MEGKYSYNNIYVITTLKFENLKVEAWRTPGWFQSFDSAMQVIRSNNGDLHEGYYNYLVMERLDEGIYPTVIDRDWYKWAPITQEHAAIGIGPDPIWGNHGWWFCVPEDESLHLVKWSGGGTGITHWENDLLIDGMPICPLG